jgi:hypothetical protein
MSDIALAYLPCRAGIGHLSVQTRKERMMSTHEHAIAMPARSPAAGSIQIIRAKAFALETIQALT